jgi:hypothetical protein
MPWPPFLNVYSNGSNLRALHNHRQRFNARGFAGASVLYVVWVFLTDRSADLGTLSIYCRVAARDRMA